MKLSVARIKGQKCQYADKPLPGTKLRVTYDRAISGEVFTLADLWPYRGTRARVLAQLRDTYDLPIRLVVRADNKNGLPGVYICDKVAL